MAGMREATLRQLQIFASAARTLSFSRTARELYLTQPAVSMQVRQLEDRAGLPLFERMKRRLYLTQAGQEMARHAAQVLRSLQEADDAFAALRGLKGGRITVAVTSTAKYFAPKLVARFARAHPEVEMRLLVNNREAVVQLLAANDVDLAIMGTPPKEVETVAASFAPHPFVIIAPPEHRLAGRRRVPLSELSGETFLVREPGSGTRAAMGRFFQERHVAVIDGKRECDVEPHVQDILSSLYYVRTVPLEVGKSVYVPNHDNGKNYPLEVRVERRERVTVDAGTFDCLVVEPVLMGEAVFKQNGRVKVWLTDDELRMPVLLKSKVFVGAIAGVLTHFELGGRFRDSRPPAMVAAR